MLILVSVLMEINKQYMISAGADKVLSFLTDLKQVTSCIPNLENLQIETPTSFKGKIKPPFSFVKGRLNIESELLRQSSEKDGFFVATVKGSSIGASFQGTMQVTVSEGSSIRIDAKVETFGLLKTIPKSLIYKAVEDIETPMLRCIKEKLEG
jgi:carbon monoxide dehydrogenase subunit G